MRIYFSKLSEDGLDDMYEYSVIESFYNFLEFPAQKLKNDTKQYLKELLKKHENDNAHYWLLS